MEGGQDARNVAIMSCFGVFVHVLPVLAGLASLVLFTNVQPRLTGYTVLYGN